MPPERIYDLLLSYASADVVDEVVLGLTWTWCATAEAGGLAMTPSAARRTFAWSGNLAGRVVGDLGLWIRSWDMHEATIGMAALNAGINGQAQARVLQQAAVPLGRHNLAVFEYFLPQLSGQKVVVVGRYPALEQYAGQLDMTVLERQPNEGDLPDVACEYVLPQADWVFLTGTSIPNKTFSRLVALSSGAQVVLMGATVPWLAELREWGVAYIAGIVVEDKTFLRQTVAEGGGVRIFAQGARYHVLDLRKV